MSGGLEVRGTEDDPTPNRTETASEQPSGTSQLLRGDASDSDRLRGLDDPVFDCWVGGGREQWRGW